MLGRVEHGLRQNQAVGGDHHCVGADAADVRQRVVVAAQFFRLLYIQPDLKRGLFDRTGLQRHAAPFGAVGLGQYQRHFKTGLDNAF